MNNYLFFRTDRIGDFLVSAILLNSIKRNDKNSSIIIIASKKNYFYIKSFNFIDEVILYPDNFFKKIKLFFYLFKKKYNLVGVLDGKKKSIYFTFFLKSNIKVLLTGKSFFKNILKYNYTKIFLFKESLSRIDEIKEILDIVSLNFNEADQYLFKEKIFKNTEYLKIQKNYLLFHFDEKWIYKDYIKEYNSIEPSFEEFVNFINVLTKKIPLNVIISSGNISNPILDKFCNNLKKYNDQLYFNKCNGQYVYVTKNLNFFDLETLVKNSSTVITCHGAVTHLASSLNKKIFDIFDKSKKEFYFKWNKHMKNYNYTFRKKFNDLSFEIIEKL